MNKRHKLIAQDTTEIVTNQKLTKLLNEKKHPTSYWGVAPTGPPHVGYYRTLAKQIDLVKAGCKHKVLIANIHAFLDDLKSPWDEVDTRGKIYKKCFQLLGLKGQNVKYILGTEYQLKSSYQLETLKASTLVTHKRATRAASEVVRMTNPKVSSLIYPIMQAMDCWALDVDIAYGGIDQRHVYMLATDLLSKLGHKPPVYVFTPLGIGLAGGEKMSASVKASRLDLFASPKDIKSKINKGYCPAGITKDNPILEYSKYLIFPKVKQFTIKRPTKYGGDIKFKKFEGLEKSFAQNKIHPKDLKETTSDYLIDILKPVRNYFEKNSDLLKTFEKE